MITHEPYVLAVALAFVQSWIAHWPYALAEGEAGAEKKAKTA